MHVSKGRDIHHNVICMQCLISYHIKLINKINVLLSKGTINASRKYIEDVHLWIYWWNIHTNYNKSINIVSGLIVLPFD